MTIKILVFFFVLSIVHFQFSIPVYAFENDIGYSKIHPASPFYFLKGIRENLELRFAQTYRVKELRQLEFALRRIREVKSLVNIDQDLIPPTLERYIVHINNLTDNHKKDQQFGVIIKDNLASHLAALQQIYGSVSNVRAKMAIRSAMNRVIQRADVPQDAKLAVCKIFLKEASSSSLNQTEQFVLRDRAQRCL